MRSGDTSRDSNSQGAQLGKGTNLSHQIPTATLNAPSLLCSQRVVWEMPKSKVKIKREAVMATGCYPQPPVPTGIAIHENGTGTATSYGSQSPLGLAFKGCHQSLTLCLCFLVSNLTHLASPGDAHSATWPPNYATGTIFLCSLSPIPLQPLSVSPASRPSTHSPCLFQKRPLPRVKKCIH